MLQGLEQVGAFAHFAVRGLAAAAGAVARPGAVARQAYSVLLGGLPLAVVAGLTTGVVVWLHTRSVLTRTAPPGSESYLPRFLTAAVVLELAPLGVGLLTAARAGASLGAELGSMRQTEQIDALEMLGLSSLRELVGPRLLACTLCLPILSVFMALSAVLGSFAAESLAGTLNAVRYFAACWTDLRLQDALPATLKTLAFGYLIGAAGCFHGLRAEGGTEGVGRAATRGVVLATLLVLVADAVLVGVIRLLGA